jgi:hypothetical protein
MNRKGGTTMKAMKDTKKKYVAPATSCDAVGEDGMLCASAVYSDNGIGYGGVDEDGTIDPEARSHRGVWDEE